MLENGSASKNKKDRPNQWLNPSVVLLLMLAISFSLWWPFPRETPETVLKYGEFKQILQDPGVTLQRVSVSRNEIRGEIVTSHPVLRSDAFKPGAQPSPVQTVDVRRFRTPRVGLETDFYLQQLIDKKIGANYEGEPEESRLMAMVWMLMTPLLMIGMVLAGALMIRWMMGGSSPLTFGRSRHKLYAEKDLKITFRDVAGIDEAVAELREVVDFLKTPQKYQILGGRIPKGVLLVGPPGTGKTLLAKAVAGEAEAPFFSMSGSDFVEMFVGVGAARVRDLFAQAEQRAPCIIFIDELDALGKSRGNGTLGGHDEREQTLNQLLVEMDGFDSNRGVIIMAATNRPETLDQALLRPGRFDRTVVVDQPDIIGREAILKVHTRNIRLAPEVDLRRVAVLTPGSVGADLANLVNEAALMAARNNKSDVGMVEFEEAIERGAVGLERKSRIMRADEKQRVAYHEAGHALVTVALPNTHPVQKVSIIPRGVGALGYVLSRPEDDRYLTTQSELESRIRVLLGGTLAEELIFREVSTGATSDLQKASGIARSMVKEFGMSRLGRIYFQEQNRSTFLAGFNGEQRGDFSELTAREIDMEVRQILDTATRQVRALLLNRRSALEALAQRLIEKEVIDGVELRQILDQFHTAPQLVPGSQPVGELVARPAENGTPIIIAPGDQAGTV